MIKSRNMGVIMNIEINLCFSISSIDGAGIQDNNVIIIVKIQMKIPMMMSIEEKEKKMNLNTLKVSNWDKNIIISLG